MIAEKEAKKTHIGRARDGSIDCSCEREQMHHNLKKN